VALPKIPAIIRIRRGTASEWSDANPVLEEGEMGLVLQGGGAGRVKAGDGVTPWNNLPFLGDNKQDRITVTGPSNLLTAPESPGGQPGAKPVSDFVLASAKGAANGVASLDSGGKVPAGQLPAGFGGGGGGGVSPVQDLVKIPCAVFFANSIREPVNFRNNPLDVRAWNNGGTFAFNPGDFDATSEFFNYWDANYKRSFSRQQNFLSTAVGFGVYDPYGYDSLTRRDPNYLRITQSFLLEEGEEFDDVINLYGVACGVQVMDMYGTWHPGMIMLDSLEFEAYSTKGSYLDAVIIRSTTYKPMQNIITQGVNTDIQNIYFRFWIPCMMHTMRGY